MKKILILLFIGLLMTGCDIINIHDQSIDGILETVLHNKMELQNEVAEGYKYYVPRGMKIASQTDYNTKLHYLDYDYYLYVDVISYYHKVPLEYTKDEDAFFAKPLEYDGKTGYIEIHESNGRYFIEVMYHYAKVEAYVKQRDLKDSLVYICYLLSSISFNDQVLETLVGENILNYKEESFNIFKPKREVGNFLDYIKEYDRYPGSDEEDLNEDEITTGNEE